jgi:hypothetical protein
MRLPGRRGRPAGSRGILNDMGRDELDRAAARLQMACHLHEVGVAMKRAQIARENPDLDASGVTRRLVEWLHTRPGAEHGDTEGTVRTLVEPPR